MSHTSFVIYGLHDINGEIRYVGKTSDLWKRFQWHVYMKEWVIGIKLLEYTTAKHWKKREKYWIAYFGLDHLENKNKGGCGVTQHSEETKEKQRRSRLGNPIAVWTGKTLPEEMKNKIKDSWVIRRQMYGPNGRRN